MKSKVPKTVRTAIGVPALVLISAKPNKQRLSEVETKKHGHLHGHKNNYFTAYMDYKPARLYPLKGKLDQDWYVYFEILNDAGAFEKFKIRVNINRIKNLKDRKAYGIALVTKVNELLMRGINPLEAKAIPRDPVHDPGEEIRMMRIIDGLKWAKEKHDASMGPTTRNEYRNILVHIYKGITDIGYSNLTVGEFRKAHLRVVMDHVQQERKLSNNRYNTFIECLRGVYKEFVRYDAFDVSPISQFEHKKEAEAKSFEKLTDTEKKIVYDHLKKVYPEFLTYFLLIYHTALRPKELMALQISNFYLQEEAFKISPEETVILKNEVHSKTKTRVSRYVAIPGEAMELLLAMELEKFPKEYYIFSRGFKPGPFVQQRKRATEIWAREVIKNLGIDKKMYGGKGLGLGDKVKSGVPIEALKNQAGHTDQKMTEVYTSEHKKKLARELKDKAKGFLD